MTRERPGRGPRSLLPRVLAGIVSGSVLFFLLGYFLTGGPSPRIDRFGFYGAVLLYWVLAGAAGALSGSLAGAYEVVVGVLVAFGGSLLLEVFLGYLGGGVFDAGRFLLAALFTLPACTIGAALARVLSSRRLVVATVGPSTRYSARCLCGGR